MTVKQKRKPCIVAVGRRGGQTGLRVVRTIRYAEEAPLDIVGDRSWLASIPIGPLDGVHGVLLHPQDNDGNPVPCADHELAVVCVGKDQRYSKVSSNAGHALYALAWLRPLGIPVLVLQAAVPPDGWQQGDPAGVVAAIVEACGHLDLIEKAVSVTPVRRKVHMQGFSMGASMADRASAQLPSWLTLGSLVRCSAGGPWSRGEVQYRYGCPIVTVVTGRDTTIPTQQQREGVANLRRAGNGVNVVEVEGGGHAMWPSALLDVFTALHLRGVGPSPLLVQNCLFPPYLRTHTAARASKLGARDTEVSVKTTMAVKG